MPRPDGGRSSARQTPAESVDLESLRRRVLGTTFGGPDPAWCAPTNDPPGIRFAGTKSPEVSASRYTGCLKYATCNLIPDSARWKRWDEMSPTERESLVSVRCYRATGAEARWDVGALESRTTGGAAGQWIGNPFGLRTAKTVAAAALLTDGTALGVRRHRDTNPCPAGGCMTPEMEQACSDDHRAAAAEVPALHESPACPFHYRHTSPSLSHAATNPLRFAQCYATLPPFRQLLDDAGVVVVAPVHRSPESSSEPGESYWYPFYSGYAFLQIPTRAPGGSGATDDTLTPRWLLTRMTREQRHRSSRRLPITAAFEGAETGLLTARWERERRIVSVSEGQASVFLLQWVLARRLQASLREAPNATTVDLTRRTTWTYAAESEPAFRRLVELQQLGFDLAALFSLSRADEGFVRNATLEDDLQLLGLLDASGAPTARLDCAHRWLRARIAWASEDTVGPSDVEDAEDHLTLGIDQAVAAWLGETRASAERLYRLGCPEGEDGLHALACLLLAIPAGRLLRTSPESAPPPDLARLRTVDSVALSSRLQEWFEREDSFSFARLCRLVPQMHVLVRAYWTEPLRWLFVPTALEQDRTGKGAGEVQVTSGLIAIIEDDPTGLPYRLPAATVARADDPLERFVRHLPLFSLLAGAEFSLLHDDLIRAYSEWESRRPTLSQAVHFLREVSQSLSRIDDKNARAVESLIDVLAGQFFVQLRPPSFSATRSQVLVDARAAATRAVDAFNAYYGTRYCDARLTCSPPDAPATVLISPYEEAYHSHEKLAEQGHYALAFLLLDFLAQRAPYVSGATMDLNLTRSDSGSVSFQVTVPGFLQHSFMFPGDDPRDLPFGRGFHNLIGTALHLGARALRVQSLETAPPSTLISMTFEGDAP